MSPSIHEQFLARVLAEAEGESGPAICFSTAGRALGRAASYLTPWHEPRERGLFCRAVGLLRWEQGRLEEAEASAGSWKTRRRASKRRRRGR